MIARLSPPIKVDQKLGPATTKECVDLSPSTLKCLPAIEKECIHVGPWARSRGGVQLRLTALFSPSVVSLICYQGVPVATGWMIFGEMTNFF